MSGLPTGSGSNTSEEKAIHRLVELENARKRLKEYLQMKVEMEDWHGAADACNDLREVDAERAGIGVCMSYISL